MPRTFNDLKQRTWSIDLHAGCLMRMKAAGFNLFSPLLPRDLQGAQPQPLYYELLTDDAVLLELLWTLLEPQAVPAGVVQAAFYDGLSAGVITTARDAFEEEWRDFFRQRRQTQTLAQMDQLLKMAAQAVELEADLMGQAMTAEMAKARQKLTASLTGSVNAGDSAESSASIPDPSPPDNSAGCVRDTIETAGATPANSSPALPMAT